MVAHRTTFRLLLAAVLTCLSMIWPDSSRAQSVPTDPSALIMDGPIRSIRPESRAVDLMRVYLDIQPEFGASLGTAALYVAPDVDSLLVLNVSDLEIRDVRLPDQEAPAEWQVNAGQLSIRTPTSTTDSWRIDVDYRIRRGLNQHDEGGTVVALWTSSLPGRATWMPLPVDEVSMVDHHLTVAAPPGWNVVTSGMEAATVDQVEGRMVVRAAQTRIFPHAVGFLAWKGERDDGPRTITRTEAVEQIGLDEDRLNALLGTGDEISYTLLEIEGESTPAAFSGHGIRALGGLNRDHSWMRRYELLERDYGLIVAPSLRRLAPTDGWIESALRAWLALEHVRTEGGDGAAALVLEELRRQYLAEAAFYVRPLVWDRWYAASDLRDRHAETKGVWVLRMLSERVGSEALLESLRRFMVAAQEDLVDSETLREQLEVVSREDLGPFFDTWVYGAGHPVISLTYAYNAATEQTEVVLTQHQEGPLVPDSFLFDTVLQYSTLAETDTKAIQVDERTHRLALPTGMKPRFVHADAFATVLLDYHGQPSGADLVSQLRYSVALTSTIRSLRRLSEQHPDPALLLGLRSVTTENADAAVLVAAARVLGRMAPSSSALSLLVSWTTHADPRVRTAATRELGSFLASDQAYDAALAVANNGKNAFELTAAVHALVALRPDRAWPVLRSALVTPSEGDLVRIGALQLIQPGVADENAVAQAVLPLLDLRTDVSAAALLCLARLFPEGPKTTRTIDTWLMDASYQKRVAALSILESRTRDELSASNLKRALDREPTLELRRRIDALLLKTLERSEETEHDRHSG
jgi:hypothetical protein